MARYIQTNTYDSESSLLHSINMEYEIVDAENINLEFKFEEYNKEIMELIYSCIQKYLAVGYIPKIKVDFNGFEFKVSDFDSLIDLEDFSKKQGLEIGFVEDSVEYSLDDTISAFIKCKSFAEYIKSVNASPFEKYLMIYRYITSFVYKENREDPKSARRIISIMNSTDIVCVGYSKLLEYLCKEAGIFCETQKLDVMHTNINRIGAHQNNIVYLKDEKYGIDGFYYVDSCWDSHKKNREPFLQYNYALLPFEDTKKLSGKKLRMYAETAILYDDEIYDEMLLSNTICRKTANKLGFNFKEKIKVPNYFREYRKKDSKVFHVTEQVKQMFRDAGIVSDFYNIERHKSIPVIFYPEFFIALLTFNPPQIEKANEVLSLMTQFQQTGYDALKEKDSVTKELHSYGYDDIYEEFDKFNQGEINFNIWDMENYYENLMFLQEFTSAIEQIKASSKPVPIEVFEQGIKNSLIAEGYDEKHATAHAARSVKASERRAELIFDNDATNCFSVSALEKRRLKEK